MPLRVFVAGATGVVGRHVLPELRRAGHHVTALARRESAATALRGVDGVVVADLMDPGALRRVMTEAAPDVVVHQASAFSDTDRNAGVQRTARLRETGTRHLVDAAIEAGARRVVVQSMADAYVPHGHDVLDEEAPLWTEAPGHWGELVRAVSAMEETVLTHPEIDGVSLRYGALYGPGTAYAAGGAVHQRVCGSAIPLVEDGIGLMSFTHVDDAAGAVLEVLEGVEPAAYNVVDNEPAETSEWLPTYARMSGGPAPLTLTPEQARAQLDWLTVHQLTEQRGATNFRFRETAGWRPVWPSWREGFAALFDLWPG